MKQRFLNQKLGKRMSRRGEVQKAKALATKPGLLGKTRQVSSAPPGKS